MKIWKDLPLRWGQILTIFASKEWAYEDEDGNIEFFNYTMMPSPICMAEEITFNEELERKLDYVLKTNMVMTHQTLCIVMEWTPQCFGCGGHSI
jgi:hypothetical protein